MARSCSSTPKDRWSPRSAANVKGTHSTPGARSIDDTPVGSQAKKKVTSASNANTTTDRNPLRVRSSIARSLRAIDQAADQSAGALPRMASSDELSILRREARDVE